MKKLLVSIEEKKKYISIGGAEKLLEVSNTSVWYYIKGLDLETFKFPFDTKTYLLRSDVERVRRLREAARSEAEQGVPA